MHWQSFYRVGLVLHRKGEDMPNNFARGYVPRADVMLCLAVMSNLMNQNICSIVTFVDVFVQVLHSCYQYTGFNIDVAIEFLAQVGIVWNDEPVIQKNRFFPTWHTFFHSPTITPKSIFCVALSIYNCVISEIFREVFGTLVVSHAHIAWVIFPTWTMHHR